MKTHNSPSKQTTTQANATSVTCASSAISGSSVRSITAQRMQATINSSPRQTAQRVGIAQQRVIQAKWNLEEVLKLLRATTSGQEAIKRLQAGNGLSIIHHKANGSFHNCVVDSSGALIDEMVDKGGVIVPRMKNMDGFAEPDQIRVTDEMDSYHAAAMIIHESTHSIQKQPGELCSQHNTIIDQIRQDLKLAKTKLSSELSKIENTRLEEINDAYDVAAAGYMRHGRSITPGQTDAIEATKDTAIQTAEDKALRDREAEEDIVKQIEAALRKARKDKEYAMEHEAHLNQFAFELETNHFSEKGKRCFDSSTNSISLSALNNLIKELYFGEKPASLYPDKEIEAAKENMKRREAMLTQFKDPSNIHKTYTPSDIQSAIKALP